MGLFKRDAEEYLKKYAPRDELPAEVIAIAEERKQARAQKNWAKSDELRDKIKELGYAVKDTQEGYELSKLQRK